jgi:hypothetical protein
LWYIPGTPVEGKPEPEVLEPEAEARSNLTTPITTHISRLVLIFYSFICPSISNFSIPYAWISKADRFHPLPLVSEID